jgi:homoserine kinase
VTIVRSPASSANVGPGFDVFGLALAIYVYATDDPSRTDDTWDACGQNHIARIAYERAGGTQPMWFKFDFAPGRGLGFSAAARAAGATLAYLQAGMSADHAQQLAYEIGLTLEGHGDNAAPATFGGIHIIAGETRHRLNAQFPAEVIVWVPATETTPTDENRAGMTSAVNRSDAVFNLGRLGVLIAAIYEGNASLLACGTEDRLHQADRLLSSPASKDALHAALDAGSYAAWLSGSGPSVAVAVSSDRVEEISALMPIGGQVLRPGPDESGAVAI